MKNNTCIRLLSTAVALIFICMAVSSCQLSKLKHDESTQTSTDSNASESGSLNTPSDNQTHEKMDIESLDITKYVTLGEYKNFKFETRSDVFTDEEFRKTIDDLIKNNPEPEKITDRLTAAGDTLNIDFEGYMDGVQFENGTASSQTIELSEYNGYIPGFDADLYGIMPGTTVETNVTFPDDYSGNVSFQGKAAVFRITVNYICGDMVEPEYNDDFVKKITAGEKNTVEEFEEYYFDLLKKHKVTVVREEEKDKAWNAFKECCTVIEVPQQQIDYYYYLARDYYETSAALYGLSYEQFALYIGLSDDSLKENAYESAFEDILLEAIYRAENLTFTDDDYKTMLKDYADVLMTTPEEVLSQYGEETLKSYFKFDKAKILLASYSEYTVVEDSGTSET